MLEVRIHGRGGQGNVVAAYLLASAAIAEGRHAQAFPAFGAERRGAPVVAFVRIDDRPIRQRCQVVTPQFLIIQDDSLLHVPGVTEGLQPGGGILVNSGRDADTLLHDASTACVSVPAGHLAQSILGRPVPNTALLAAFLTLTAALPLAALETALAERFSGNVLERNQRLVQAAAARVPAGAWQAPEAAHAAGA